MMNLFYLLRRNSDNRLNFRQIDNSDRPGGLHTPLNRGMMSLVQDVPVSANTTTTIGDQ